MAANATSQTTTHSGGDASVAKSQRTNDQRQAGEQHSVVTQEQSRNGAETRTTDGTRKEDSTNSRDSTSRTAGARGQTVNGETTQAQTTEETSSTEHPLVLRRSTESGGGHDADHQRGLCRAGGMGDRDHRAADTCIDIDGTL